MNDLKVFNHDQFGQLEILITNGKEHFPATDIAKKLGYADPYSAIRQHTKKDGWVNHPVIDSLGRTQDKRFITEGNLYRLITNSKLPDAEKFEAWVFDEVLPSIRKHGAYATPGTIENIINDPEFGIKLLTSLKEERELHLKERTKRERAERKIKQQKPKVVFAESCLVSQDSVLVKDVAKLANNQGVKIGQNRLYNKLRDWGYIQKRNTQPTQRAIETGYFEILQRTIQTPEGSRLTRTTKVTTKGQMRILNRLKDEQEVAQ